MPGAQIKKALNESLRYYADQFSYLPQVGQDPGSGAKFTVVLEPRLSRPNDLMMRLSFSGPGDTSSAFVISSTLFFSDGVRDKNALTNFAILSLIVLFPCD